MPSPTPPRPSRTNPPTQHLRRSLKIRCSPVDLQLSPLSTAFTPITLVTPLSTVFTYSHRGVGVCPRSFPSLGPACPPHSWRANPVFSNSCALFFSLCALFRARFLYFQQLAHSSTKNRGLFPRAGSAVSVSLRYHLPVDSLLLCFHILTNPFSRNPFLCTYKTPGLWASG